MAFITEIGSSITTVLNWFGTVISSIVNAPSNGAGGELNALLPIFSIGVAVTVIFATIGLVKKFCWGA